MIGGGAGVLWGFSHDNGMWIPSSRRLESGQMILLLSEDVMSGTTQMLLGDGDLWKIEDGELWGVRLRKGVMEVG